MNLSALFPPTLVSRLLDDLGAIADSVRILPRLERELLGRLDALYRELAPIQQLPLVRQELQALQATVDRIAERLDAIDAIRGGIEPLDDDLRQVRDSVDTLEPLIAQVNTRLGALDQRIETLRADLPPLGELADKVPGVG